MAVPMGPFDRPKFWGHPWHGRVLGGSLLLPNGSSMAYPQPAGTFHWEYSAAHKLTVPGVPAAVRTTAEQASDAADGKQWLTSAIISGSNSQIYGKPLGAGRFVWVDSAGDRWLVDASALHGQTWMSGTVPATATIKLRRFGVLGPGVAAETSIAVTIPDLGQASPDVRGGGGAVQSSFISSLYSIHPQGARACFMLHYSLSGNWPSSRFPCGWYELQLSGTGTAPSLVIAVIANRLQALGGVATTSESSSGGEKYSLWLRNRVEDVALDTTHPGCSGHRLQITDALISSNSDPFALGYYQPYPGPAGAVLGLTTDYSVSESIAWTGLIMACWYAESGALRQLTLEMSWSQSITATGSGGSGSGERSVRYDSVDVGSSCELQYVSHTDYSLSLTTSETVSESAEFRLKVDGVTVAQDSMSYAGSAEATLTFYSTLTNHHWTMTGSYSGALSGAGWNGTPEAAFSESVSWTESDGYRVSPSANLGYMMKPGSEEPGWRGNQLAIFSYNHGWADSANRRGIGIRPVLLGHAIASMMRNTETPAGTTWSLTGASATPTGAGAAIAWSHYVATSAYNPPVNLHAAWNPMSGAIVSSVTTPVCFV